MRTPSASGGERREGAEVYCSEIHVIQLCRALLGALLGERGCRVGCCSEIHVIQERGCRVVYCREVHVIQSCRALLGV